MVKLTRMFPLLALLVAAVLPVLPAEGQIVSGTATGIQRPGKTGVTVIGLHNPGPIDVITGCPFDNVTVLAVINDNGIIGSDVWPFNDGVSPLTLPLVGGAGSAHCIYEKVADPPFPGPPQISPRVRLLLGADGPGNTFSFRLEYRQGTYLDDMFPFEPTTPRFCPQPPPPVLPALVAMTTAFVLSIGPPGVPPIRFEETVDW